MPPVSIDRISRSSDPSGSESFPVRSIFVGARSSSPTVAVSGFAVGSSLPPVTVTLTVAVSVPPSPSVTT